MIHEGSALKRVYEIALSICHPDNYGGALLVDELPVLKAAVIAYRDTVSGSQWQGCSLCDDPNAWMDKWKGVCPRCNRELPIISDTADSKQK